jgi:prepilin-type N-terminal cleavage/methylation domain-containing protein
MITARTQSSAASPAPTLDRAFTLVELLVVIVIIGILMSLVLLVGGRVLNNQKRTTTQNTMRLTEMAIDQFKTTDPLQNLYDNPKLRYTSGTTTTLVGRTFGPYPPYQVDTDSGVGQVVERYHAFRMPPSISDRLLLDLSGSDSATAADYVALNEDDASAPRQLQNNDTRALYSYLAGYAPGVLSQVPESAKKPLSPGHPEFINPTGAGTATGSAGLLDVMAIVDAWGVPLDYGLQIRIEARWDDTASSLVWTVTDRVPFLRSKGVSAEIVAQREPDDQDAIYSLPLASPYLITTDQEAIAGTLPALAPGLAGWVRVVPSHEASENFPYAPLKGN